MRAGLVRDIVMGWLQENRPDWTVEKHGTDLLIEGVLYSLHSLRAQSLYGAGARRLITNNCDKIFHPDMFNYKRWKWEQARPHVLPRLDNVSIYRPINRNADLHHDFTANVAARYSLITPHAYFSVKIDNMVDWGQTPDMIRVQAIENLSRRTRQMNVRIIHDNIHHRGPIFYFTGEDPYHNAERLLLPEIRREFVEHLGPIFYVAIPTNRRVMAFNGPRLLRYVQGMPKPSALDLERGERIITDDILISSPDGFSILPNAGKTHHKPGKPRSIQDVTKHMEEQLGAISRAKANLGRLQKIKTRLERGQQ